MIAQADWLEACDINMVVMKSTGVYWIGLFEVLDERGFDVKLVNACHLKKVPGRKTDISDCQWLQQLHTFGLLTGSFRPNDQVSVLRSCLRQEAMLVTHAAIHIQHMQKTLTQMNLKLQYVISDITGATGMRIIRAILDGQRDPQILAKLRDPRYKILETTVHLTRVLLHTAQPCSEVATFVFRHENVRFLRIILTPRRATDRLGRLTAQRLADGRSSTSGARGSYLGEKTGISRGR